MKYSGNERGAVILDIVLAVVILLLGTIAVMNLLIVTSRATKNDEYYLTADQIARVELETIRAGKGYTLSDRTDASLISNPANLSLLPGGQATLTVADSTLVSGAKVITVTVTWQPEDQTAKSLVMSTMVSANGPA